MGLAKAIVIGLSYKGKKTLNKKVDKNMKKDKFKADLCYVNWVLIDDKKMIPYISNNDHSKIKNILTDETAPRQLLIDKANERNTTTYALDSDFARQIADAEVIDIFSAVRGDELHKPVFGYVQNYASFLDRYTDKITRDICNNNCFGREYTTGQFAHFTEVLQNAVCKNIEDRRKEKQKFDDFYNQFNF